VYHTLLPNTSKLSGKELKKRTIEKKILGYNYKEPA
jgi:hypothetical protein